MPAISSSTKKYLPIVLAILVLVLSAVLIYTQYNALSNLRAEVEEEEMLLNASRARLNRLIDHRNNAQEYEMRLEYAIRMIPQEAGEDSILRYIQQLSKQYDMRAVEIRFDNRSIEENYTTMPILITLEGNYSDLQRLLRQLREGNRVVRVDDIRVSRTGAAGSELRVTLSTATFYNPDN